MITLSSDFGSPYPAAMKGIILQQSEARLVDVAHDLPRQDVRAAAFWLREVLPYFPPTVHLVVVDPGVGTDRAAVAVRAGDHVLVGPDNGALLPVARELATRAGSDSSGIEVFEVAYDDPASSTFHGRDVFAPAAARVHEAGIYGFESDPSFAPVTEYVDRSFPAPTVDGDRAEGEVLVVDGFGNAVTNVPGGFLDGVFGSEVTVDDEPAPARAFYAAVDPGQRLVTVGSHGNVELAVNQGRGDEAFATTVGSTIELER